MDTEGRDIRWYRHVPNALTICNSLLGFAAIVYMLKACGAGVSLDEAVKVCAYSSWLIFFAMIFDASDGFAARLLNAASMHGIQMDSLSDMVTFGVAPATMVAVLATRAQMSDYYRWCIYVMCGIYLAGAALRLATYNVKAINHQKSKDGGFSGLPSPGAAATLCTVVFFIHYSHVENEFISKQALVEVLPFYAAILGLLMTSNIPYIHAGRWIQASRRSAGKFLLLLVVIILIAIFKIEALAIIVTLYILSGPVVRICKKLSDIFSEPDKGAR